MKGAMNASPDRTCAMAVMPGGGGGTRSGSVIDHVKAVLVHLVLSTRLKPRTSDFTVLKPRYVSARVMVGRV
jgi:hypothetical protein